MIRSALAATAVATLTVAAALPAQAAQPIMLRMANSVSAMSHMNVQIFGPWCQRVTKESDGTVDARLFPSNAIASSENVWDRTLSGVVDIGYINPAYMHGLFPRTAVTTLPGVGGRSLPGSIALWDMVQPGGALHDEWKTVHILAMFAYPSTGLISTVPIHKAEQLKGMKIAAFSRTIALWVTNMGAAPVTLAFSEGYEALARGTVAAIAVGFTGVQPLKVWEVAKYYTTGDLGAGGAVAIAMNKKKYEALPARGRASVDRNSGLKYTKELGVFWDRIDDQGRELAEKHGGQVYELPKAERARWVEKAEPVISEWEKQTPEGAKVLSEYRKLTQNAANN